MPSSYCCNLPREAARCVHIEKETASASTQGTDTRGRHVRRPFPPQAFVRKQRTDRAAPGNVSCGPIKTRSIQRIPDRDEQLSGSVAHQILLSSNSALATTIPAQGPSSSMYCCPRRRIGTEMCWHISSASGSNMTPARHRTLVVSPVDVRD